MSDSKYEESPRDKFLSARREDFGPQLPTPTKLQPKLNFSPNMPSRRLSSGSSSGRRGRASSTTTHRVDGETRDEECTSVRVFVRARPFMNRELNYDQKAVIQMEGPVATIFDPKEGFTAKDSFPFDACFWSVNLPSSNAFATQKDVYENIGRELLDNAMAGYNATCLAYGMTGSGKTYTMMGKMDSDTEKGIIPRLCEDLFKRIHAQNASNPLASFKVEASCMEIYNERANDLLSLQGITTDLRVRQHPSLGPFVEGLTQVPVNDLEEIMDVMHRGEEQRAIASTMLNMVSSRSHMIFTLRYTQTLPDSAESVTQAKTRISRINLVDLAGSERTGISKVEGQHFTEATMINLSLSTLGRVIDSLVDLSQGRRKVLPPYRESLLTWILSESLGGNSKTFMVATISPSIACYDETLSTLRYCSRARCIVNMCSVNEEDSISSIADLKRRITQLQAQLKESQKVPQCECDDLRKELAEREMEVARLREDLELLEQQMTELAEENSCEVEELRDRMEEWIAANDSLTERVTEAQRKEVELRAKCQELQTRNNELETRNKGLETRNAELEIQKTNSTIPGSHELEKRNGELERQNRLLCDQNHDLQHRLETVRKEDEQMLLAVRGQLENAATVTREFQAELRSRDIKIEELETRKSQLKRRLKQAEAKARDSGHKIQTMDAYQQTLIEQVPESKIISLETELAITHKRLEAALNEINAFASDKQNTPKAGKSLKTFPGSPKLHKNDDGSLRARQPLMALNPNTQQGMESPRMGSDLKLSQLSPRSPRDRKARTSLGLVVPYLAKDPDTAQDKRAYTPRLSDESQSLQKETSGIMARVWMLKEEEKILQESIKDKNAEWAEVEAKALKGEIQCQKMEARLVEGEKRWAKMQHQVQEAEMQVKAMHMKAMDGEALFKEMGDKALAMETECQEMESRITTAEMQWKGMETRILDAEEEWMGMQGRVKDAEKEWEEMQGRVRASEKEWKGMEKRLADKEAKSLLDMEGKMKKHLASLLEAESEWNEMEAKTREAEKEWKKVQKKVADGTRRVREMEMMVADGESRWQDMEARVTSGEMKCEAICAAVQRAEEEWKDLEERAKDAERRWLLMEDQVMDAERRCNEIKDDFRYELALWEEVKERVTQSESEYARVEENIRLAEQECNQIESYVAEAERKWTEVDRRVCDSRFQLEEVMARNRENEDALEEMQARLEDARIRHEEMHELAMDAKSEWEALEVGIRELRGESPETSFALDIDHPASPKQTANENTDSSLVPNSHVKVLEEINTKLGKDNSMLEEALAEAAVTRDALQIDIEALAITKQSLLLTSHQVREGLAKAMKFMENQRVVHETMAKTRSQHLTQLQEGLKLEGWQVELWQATIDDVRQLEAEVWQACLEIQDMQHELSGLHSTLSLNDEDASPGVMGPEAQHEAMPSPAQLEAMPSPVPELERLKELEGELAESRMVCAVQQKILDRVKGELVIDRQQLSKWQAREGELQRLENECRKSLMASMEASNQASQRIEVMERECHQKMDEMCGRLGGIVAQSQLTGGLEDGWERFLGRLCIMEGLSKEVMQDHTRQVQDLENQIKELESECETLTTASKTAEERSQGLERELGAVMAEHAQTKEELRALELQYDASCDTISDQELKLQLEKDTHQMTNSQAREVRRELQILQSEHSELRACFEIERSAAADAKAEIESLQEQLHETNCKTGDLETQLALHQEHTVKLEEDVEELQEVLAAKELEMKATHSQLRRFLDERETLAEQLNMFEGLSESEAKRHASVLQANGSWMANLRDQYNGLAHDSELQLQKLKEERQAMEQRYNEVASECHEATLNRDQAVCDLQNMQQQCSALNEKLKQLEAELQEEKRLSDAQARQLDKEMEGLIEQHAELMDTVDAERRSTISAQDEKEALSKKLEHMTAKHAEAESQVMQHKEFVSKLEDEAETQLMQHNDFIAKMEEEIDEIKKAYVEQTNRLKDEVTGIGLEKERLTEELCQMEAQLQDLKAADLAKQKEAKIDQDRIVELEAEIEARFNFHHMSSQERIVELEAEIEGLQESQADWKAKLELNQAEMCKVQVKNGHLTTEVTHLREELNEARTQSEARDLRIAQLQTVSDSLVLGSKSTVAEHKRVLASLQERCQELEMRCEAQSADTEAKNSELSMLQIKHGQLEKQLGTEILGHEVASTNLNDLTEKYLSSCEREKKLEAELEEVEQTSKGQMQKLETEIETLYEQHAELMDTVEAERSATIAAKEELESTCRQLEDARCRHAEAEKEIASHEQKIAQLQEKTKKVAKMQDADTETLQQKLETLSAEREDLLEQIARLEGCVESERQLHVAQRQAQKEVEDRCEELKMELAAQILSEDRMAKRVQHMEEELRVSCERVKELEGNVKESRDASSRDVDMGTIARLEREVDVLVEQHAELTRALEDERRTVAAAKDVVRSMSSQREDAEEKCIHAEERAQQHGQEMDAMKQRVQQLEVELRMQAYGREQDEEQSRQMEASMVKLKEEVTILKEAQVCQLQRVQDLLVEREQLLEHARERESFDDSDDLDTPKSNPNLSTQLVSERDRLLQEVYRLKGLAEEAQLVIQNHSQQAKVMNHRIEELETQLEEEILNQVRLSEEIQTMDKKYSDELQTMEDKYHRSCERIGELQKERGIQKSSPDRDTHTLNQKLEQECVQLEERVQRLQEELQETSQASYTQASQLHQEIESLVQQHAEVVDILEAERRAAQSTVRQLQDLQSRHAVAGEELQHFKDLAFELESENAQLRESQAASIGEVHYQESGPLGKFVELEGLYEDEIAAHKLALMDHKNLQTKHLASLEELDTLRRECDRLARQLDVMKTLFDANGDSLVDPVELVADLEDELESSKSTLQEVEDQFTSWRAAAEKREDQQLSTAEALMTAAAEQQALHAELATRYSELQKEHEALQTSHMNLVEELLEVQMALKVVQNEGSLSILNPSELEDKEENDERHPKPKMTTAAMGHMLDKCQSHGVPGGPNLCTSIVSDVPTIPSIVVQRPSTLNMETGSTIPKCLDESTSSGDEALEGDGVARNVTKSKVGQPSQTTKRASTIRKGRASKSPQGGESRRLSKQGTVRKTSKTTTTTIKGRRILKSINESVTTRSKRLSPRSLTRFRGVACNQLEALHAAVEKELKMWKQKYDSLHEEHMLMKMHMDQESF